MHLAELRLLNYRAFPEAVVTLPATVVSLVVGASNSGKSALLSAIDLIVGNAGAERVQHAKRTGGVNPGLVRPLERGVDALDKSTRHSGGAELPGNKSYEVKRVIRLPGTGRWWHRRSEK